MIRVVDVSEWQGTINFDKFVQAVKQGHVHGMIIRTGFGMYTEDSQAKRNIQMCNQLGIPYGVYHYSYARNLAEAETEVDGMLASLKEWGAKPNYPIVIDMEDADNWKKNNWLSGDYWKVQSDIVDYFCKRIEQSGNYAMWYASAYWVTNLSKYNNLLEKYDLWLAQWQVSAPEYSCGIWQYTAEGDIAPGVNGHTLGMATQRLDLNYVYKDYQALITGKSQSKAVDKPKLKTSVEIVQEILAGLWGNGDERKAKLTKAGYNYDEIQELVNKKLANKKSDDEMVAEIKSGKWGNGDERKQRLTQAGYDYNYLQKLVNESYVKRKTYEEVAREVIRGLWGNGRERFAKLQQAGYDADAIQKIVNNLMK